MTDLDMKDFLNQEKSQSKAIKGTTAKAATTSRRGYAGKSATQLAQQRYWRLLEAGLQLFGTQGYAGTAIDKICAQAKVTTRHFYEQFKDKESLLISVFEWVMQDTKSQVFTALIGQNLTSEAQFVAALNVFFTAQLSDPRRARLTTTEVLGVSAAVEAKRHAVMNQFGQLIEVYMNHLASQNRLPARNYRILAIGLVGAMHELQMAWLNPANGLSQQSLEHELRFLARAFLQGAHRADRAAEA